MDNKTIPFDNLKVETWLDEFGSPLYVYDEQGIIATAQEINKAFSWAKNYKNYFAVKATPTPKILKLLHEQGMGFDCSSRAELEMVSRIGVRGKDIFYTSNNTPKEDFELAIELEAIVNIDDLTQVPVFLSVLNGRSYPYVAVRYNPGDKQSGNEIIGEPLEAKYGMTLDQVIDAMKMLNEADIAEFGIHTMVASNETHEEYFGLTAKLVAETIEQVHNKTHVRISFVNLGGGFGIPYDKNKSKLDINKLAQLVRKELPDPNLDIFTENGRFITGPHGYLLTKVRYVMKKYKNYIGVDASMHNLMRPGMYGAYHHITVLGKGDSGEYVYDIVGSLCENNDKFAINRSLPEVEVDDNIVIHDAGAHGHAMGFNYNGLLKSAEVLVRGNGETELVRRAETVDDYFAKIVW